MVLQAFGLIIGAAVLVQVLFLLYTSIRQNQGTLKLLDQQIKDAMDAADMHHKARQQKLKQTGLSWVGYRKFEVQRKIVEDGNKQVCSFYLAPHDRRPLPSFKAGQFLTFQLNIPSPQNDGGRSGRPTIRCYSLSDAPNSEYFRVSIKRVPPPRNQPDAPPGLSSNFFHDSISEGDILDVKAPSGNFYLDIEHESPVVLIGGGIGITPMLSMLFSLVKSGTRREVRLFYGVRNSLEQIEKDRLLRIAEENENVHLHLCYSRPNEDDKIDKDYHHKGFISVELFKQLLPSNNYQYYLCGPPPMMEAVFSDLSDWGVPEEDIHFEAFGPATIKKSKASQAVEVAAKSADDISVTFSKSGKACTWDPAAASLLEFAEANDVVIDSGCQVGNCNTCWTAIKDGDVNYVHEPDTMPEKGSCLTCVSIPAGNLVLDA